MSAVGWRIAFDADKWITTKGNGDGPGRHVKIDDKTGVIKAGLGGKFDGKKISDVGKGNAATRPDATPAASPAKPASSGKAQAKGVRGQSSTPQTSASPHHVEEVDRPENKIVHSYSGFKAHSGSEKELISACSKLRAQSLTEQPTEDESEYLDDYTGVAYSWTNAGLRSGDPEMEDEPQVKALTDYINKASLAEDTVLYRGFSSEIAENNPDFLKPGAVIRDLAFVSTSIDRDIAADREGADEGNVFVMHIYAKKGAKALPINGQSSFVGENEVLIQRGSEYKIVSVDEKAKTIHAELL